MGKQVNAISAHNYRNKVEPYLNESQQEVYDCICQYPNGINSKALGKVLRKEHNRYSGRITELTDLGLIVGVDIVEVKGAYCFIWLSTKYI